MKNTIVVLVFLLGSVLAFGQVKTTNNSAKLKDEAALNKKLVQNKIDSTQIFIGATLKAIRTSSIKMIANNAVGTIVISKEHPMIVNLIKSTEPNSEKIERYGSIGVFDNCQVNISSSSSMKLNQVKIGMQLGTEMVSMSSVKGYISSGDCDLTGNYSVNGKPITFENTKIVYDDNINAGKVSEGGVCIFDSKTFTFLNGTWLLSK